MQGIFNSAGCHLVQTKFEDIQRSLLFNLTAAHHGQCKDIWKPSSWDQSKEPWPAHHGGICQVSIIQHLSQKQLVRLATSHEGLSYKKNCQNVRHLQPLCLLLFAAYQNWKLSRKCIWQCSHPRKSDEMQEWRKEEVYSVPSGGRMHLVSIEDSLDHVFFNQPCMQLTCRSQRVHSSVFGKHRGTPRGSAIVPSSKTGTAHNLSILQPPRKGLDKEQVCWKGEHFPPSCRLFVSEWSLNTFKPVLVSSWCWVDIALELEDFQTTIGQASTNNSPNPRLSFGLSMKSATAACRATAPKKTIGWTASKSHLMQLATAHEGLSNTQICQNAKHLGPGWLPLAAYEIQTLWRKSSFQYDCNWTLLCLEICRLLYWA